MEEQSIERFLALALARVTERGAVAAARLRGRGDEMAADGLLRAPCARNCSACQSRVWSSSESAKMMSPPPLFVGERIGAGGGPRLDLAVAPLEGSTLCAKDMPGAISVIAMAKAVRCFVLPMCTWTRLRLVPATRPV